MKKIFLIVLLSMFLFGCHRLTEGYVVDKEFKPEHTYTYYTTQKIGSSTITTPHVSVYPDSWHLIVRGEIDDKTITESFRVTQEVYEKTNIGAFYKAETK